MTVARHSNPLTDMTAHLEWADAALWETVLACDGAADDERLRFLLHHIHTVQRAFWQMWREEEIQFRELDSFADPRAIATWGRETLSNVNRWLAGATGAQLDRPLSVPWSERLTARLGRPAEDATVAESIVQLAIHSAHHRGQAATRLAELGGAPPLNDFIYWVWAGRPQADWEGM